MLSLFCRVPMTQRERREYALAFFAACNASGSDSDGSGIGGRAGLSHGTGSAHGSHDNGSGPDDNDSSGDDGSSPDDDDGGPDSDGLDNNSSDSVAGSGSDDDALKSTAMTRGGKVRFRTHTPCIAAHSC